MKILFDQGTPVPLRPYLLPHLVRTAAQEGWASLRNGDLLNAAEAAGFDLLITMDRNLGHQQNLGRRLVAIIALDLQQWPRLRPHAEEVAEQSTPLRQAALYNSICAGNPPESEADYAPHSPLPKPGAHAIYL